MAEFSLAGAGEAYSGVPGQRPLVGSLLSSVLRLGWLFRGLFGSFAGVGAQNEADAEKLRRLGCRPEAIRVVGSLKFDAARLEEHRLLDVPALLHQLGVPAGARVLVAGSTHAGEEALLAEVYLRLRERFPDLFLVLVPRHFERGREVGRELQARGVRFAYRNELTASTQYPPDEIECLLVNTTGELRHFYEHATVIFVGKSLTAQGGQNPIEPGRWASRWFLAPTCRIRRGGPRLSCPGRRDPGARRRRVGEGPG